MAIEGGTVNLGTTAKPIKGDVSVTNLTAENAAQVNVKAQGEIEMTKLTGKTDANMNIVSLTDAVSIDELALSDTIAEIVSRTDLTIGTQATARPRSAA